MVRIAVDAMGGDHALSAVVDRAVSAPRHLAVRQALVGRSAVVEAALSAHGDWPSLGIEAVRVDQQIATATTSSAR